MNLLTAIKLSEYFLNHQRIGQSIFPELIKKLIIATANCKSIRFPAGDSIWAHGFDGIIKDISKGCRIVPDGESVWELGTDKNSKKKANSDFETRSNKYTSYDKKQYTFVFCTPHIWNGNILEWETEKNNQGIWKNVVLLDAAIIADWLNENIEVAIWLLNEFGESIQGITSLELELKNIQESTSPKLTNEMLICSNEKEAKELVQSLRNADNSVNIIKPSTNIYQGYLFVLGALANEGSEEIKAKVVVVKDMTSLKFVSKNCNNKIIIVNFIDYTSDFPVNCNTQNIYIFIANNKNLRTTLNLSPIFFEDFRRALVNMGIKSDEANEITLKTNRNISCFIRLHTINPLFSKPSWADDVNKNDIIPIALLSEVNISRVSDKEIVSRLIDDTFENYIERLDSWLNKDDSPIFKDGDDIYKIYSKEEAIHVLGIKYNSPKAKILEDICKKDIFTNTNPKFEISTNHWHMNDGCNKYSEYIINGILASFAIMSNKHNQSHYDAFISEILFSMKEDSVLLNTYISDFALMAEVSAKAIIDFVNYLLDNDEYVIKNFLIGQRMSYFQSDNLLQLYWALEQCLLRREYAIEAQRALLKIYLKNYESTNKKQIDDGIITSFLPLMSCEHAISATEKMEILLASARTFSENDKKMAEAIFYKLNSSDSIIYLVPSKPRWKEYKKYDDSYYPEEWLNVHKQATKWLLENASDKVKLFSEIMNFKFLNLMNESELNNIFDELNDKIIKENSDKEIRRLLNNEAGRLMREFKRRLGDKNYSIIEKRLKFIFKETSSDDLIERYKYIFEKEHLNVYDFCDTDNERNYQALHDKMTLFIRGVMQELVNSLGENVLFKIIEITNDCNYEVWSIIYDYCNNKIAVMQNLLKLKKNMAFIRFIELQDGISEEVMNMILNISDETQKAIIIKSLPLTDEFIDLAEKNNIEGVFWSRPYIFYKGITNKIYLKMLKYCPINLLPNIMHMEGGLKYDVAIEVLKTIVAYINNLRQDERPIFWNMNSFHNLTNFIETLDNIYYTDELIDCELNLLPIYLENCDNYPSGVKKFFFKNPQKFLELFTVLLKDYTTENNAEDTIGKKILFNALFSFGKSCIIPTEYIISKEEELIEWCNSILLGAAKGERKIFREICIILGNILALCPETKEQTVWPSKVVADILDGMAALWNMEDVAEINALHQKYNPDAKFITKERYIANHFAIAKTNTIGVRSVTDGSHELKMAEIYTSYMNQYRSTNPITAEALRLIIAHYQRDGEDDRQRAISGREFC